MIIRAIKQERSEVGDLAKTFFRPAGSTLIMNILGQLALIDDELDDREKEFIQTFADTWSIPFSFEELIQNHEDKEASNFIILREYVADYLKLTPPSEQVRQLYDTILALVNIDETVTPEEEVIVSELGAMLLQYVDHSTVASMYEVHLVPQNKEHESLIKSFLPDGKRENISGGYVYIVGKFYAEDYAEIVARKYMEMGLLAFVSRKQVIEEVEQV
jgi:hypothetical protein